MGLDSRPLDLVRLRSPLAARDRFHGNDRGIGGLKLTLQIFSLMLIIGKDDEVYYGEDNKAGEAGNANK